LNRSLKKVNNNVEVLFFLKNTGISNSMWIWTWKKPKNCGKSSPKYFQGFTLRILIYTESIKTKSRKRQVIH